METVMLLLPVVLIVTIGGSVMFAVSRKAKAQPQPQRPSSTPPAAPLTVETVDLPLPPPPLAAGVASGSPGYHSGVSNARRRRWAIALLVLGGLFLIPSVVVFVTQDGGIAPVTILSAVLLIIGGLSWTNQHDNGG
jgi:hypothetical protein